MNYLLTSSVCLAIFSIVYQLFLKSEKAMVLQRAYLLLVVVFALLIPMVDLDWSANSYTQSLENYAPHAFLLENSDSMAEESPTSIFTLYNIAAGIYVLGVCLMLLRVILTFKKLFHIIQNGEIIKTDSVCLVHTDAEIPISSFFKYIFLSSQEEFTEDEYQSILQHEKKHVSDWHSADIVLLELMKIIFWFNPTIYLIDRWLRSLHEFISDNAAVKYYSIPLYEKLLVQALFKKVQMPLLSQFSEVSVKKRIDMLNQKPPHTMRKIKFLLIIPVAMALAWACDPAEVSNDGVELSQDHTVTGRILDEEGNPMPGTNIIVEGTTVGTVADIKGNYKLTVPAGGKQLAFSSIGKETQKVPIGNRDVIDVELSSDPAEAPAPLPQMAVGRKDLVVTQEVVTENGEYFIVGTVSGKDSKPLPGINIVLSGHKIGTVSDINGKFKLKVPEAKGKIIYAFTGFNAVTKSFGDE